MRLWLNLWSWPARAPKTRARTRLRVETLEVRALLSANLFSSIDGTNSSNSSCGCTPPDTTGAAGPTVVIEDVNSALATFNKVTGALMSRQSLSSFFSPLGGVLSLSDPVIFYDDLVGRFVIADLDYNSTSQSRLDVAFSNDSNPSDGYQFQRYNMNDGVGGFDFADYPKGGYNADAYVFSFNMFPNSGGTHVDTLAIDKNNFANSFRVNAGSSHFTLAPAVMHNANPGDPMWLVETGSSTSMRVVKMTNVLSSSPNFQTFTVSVPSYTQEPNPRQPGGSTIVSFDTRVLNAAYNDGLLVAGHTIGAGGLSQARWYEFNTTTATPTLVQSGNVFRGSGVYTFFPTVDINSEDDIGMTFMESSTSEFLSMYVTGQLAGDAGSGQVEVPAEVFAGTSVYTSSRIGDYSGTSVDPSDGLTFWAANEYKGSASQWNTAVGGFQMAQPVALPFSDDFSNGSGNWTPSSNPNSFSVITDGVPVYQAQNTGSPVSISSAGDTSWTDYTYQADVKVTSLGSGGSVTLLARFLDNNNYYGFRYNQSTGTVQIIKEFQGVQSVLASSGPVSVHLNQTYTPVITVSGNSLSVAIGNVVVSATDSSITSGKVGVSDSNGTAEFTNVLVNPPPTTASGPALQVSPLQLAADGTAGGAPVNTGTPLVALPVPLLDVALGDQPINPTSAPVTATDVVSAGQESESPSLRGNEAVGLSVFPGDVVGSGF